MRTTKWFGRGGGRALAGAVVVLLCAGLAAPVYAQELDWAWRAGGQSSDELGSGIAVDAAGHSTVTGLFRGTATFGAGEANETILTSAGSFDIFVAKFFVGTLSVSLGINPNATKIQFSCPFGTLSVPL